MAAGRLARAVVDRGGDGGGRSSSSLRARPPTHGAPGDTVRSNPSSPPCARIGASGPPAPTPGGARGRRARGSGWSPATWEGRPRPGVGAPVLFCAAGTVAGPGAPWAMTGRYSRGRSRVAQARSRTRLCHRPKNRTGFRQGQDARLREQGRRTRLARLVRCWRNNARCSPWLARPTAGNRHPAKRADGRARPEPRPGRARPRGIPALARRLLFRRPDRR